MKATRDWRDYYDISPTGCWEWNRALDRRGYGEVHSEGRTQRAHRVVYRALVGNLPDDLTIDHLCRNPRCVNPDHLEPVTLEENTHRQGEYYRSVREPYTANPGAWYQLGGYCRRGHLLTAETLRVQSNGYNRCHPCKIESLKAWKDRERAAAAS